MLTAMVYLNPDSKEQRTQWIDPILAPSTDRKEWESALFALMATEKCNDETMEKYWWKYIQEGVEMGQKIESFLQPPRTSDVKEV